MKEEVKKTYSGVVKEANSSLPESSCCTTDKSIYEELLAELPEEVLKMSWGCGNPLAVDILQPGDTVVDIGCGAGLDVLLAAKKVGPAGQAIGVDFTEEMLERARRNAGLAGLSNTKFLYGEAENLPLDDNSVSVVTSNCVLNLVPDKKAAFQEIVRVLKPGGRFLASDIVSEKELPEEIKQDPQLWSSCIGGALPEKEYLRLLGEVGLRGIVLFSRQAIQAQGVKLYSITLQAVKPDGKTRYLFPALVQLESDGSHIFLDPELPAWFSTNASGAKIVQACNEKRPAKSLAHKVVGAGNGTSEEAVLDFLCELDSRRIALTNKPEETTYPGRKETMGAHALSELWLHTNNNCNSRCRHCLVSAGGNANHQLALPELTRIVREGRSLGVTRFYLTGGEPFLHPDIFELAESILSQNNLVVLTNGTLLRKYKKRLTALPNQNHLLFQVSLEGASAAVHDALRGAGTFDAAVSGIKTLIDLGMPPVVASTLTSLNADHLPETCRFLSRLGIRHYHIHWLHQHGRAKENNQLVVPPNKMVLVMRELEEVAGELGMTLDNHKAACVRVTGRQGRKYDLCHAACSTLAVGPEGETYPCPAFVGQKDFLCGSLRELPLEDIWAKSACLNQIRSLSLIDQPQCRQCPVRFFCGGGCLSYKYFASGKLEGLDPYCLVHKEVLYGAVREIAETVRKAKVSSTEGDLPKIYSVMNPPLKRPGKEFDVAAFHCACVLATKGSGNGCGC